MAQAILLEDVESLGERGAVVDVSAGSLRNYLLPRKLALLVTEPPAKGDYRDAVWLVRRYALSEVPSPRSFVLLRGESAQHAPAPRPFLGLRAPAFVGSGGSPGGPQNATPALRLLLCAAYSPTVRPPRTASMAIGV